jgi:hypothetical protein
MCGEVNKKIVAMYNNGHGSPSIAKEVGLTFHQVLNILKKEGITLRSARDSARKYSFNENFFETIDSPEKAYIIGFIIADGSLNEKRVSLKISIHNKDKEILNRINIIMESDKKIYERFNRNGFSSNGTPLCELVFTSPKITSDLIKLGIRSNKTFNCEIPKIKQHLLSHFWRGMLDGDGHISISKRGKCTPSLETGICGNIHMMNALSEYMTSLGIINKITKDKSIFRVRICAMRALKFLDYLYENDTISLIRKKEKYLHYKSIRQQFSTP